MLQLADNPRCYDAILRGLQKLFRRAWYLDHYTDEIPPFWQTVLECMARQTIEHNAWIEQRIAEVMAAVGPAPTPYLNDDELLAKARAWRWIWCGALDTPLV